MQPSAHGGTGDNMTIFGRIGGASLLSGLIVLGAVAWAQRDVTPAQRAQQLLGRDQPDSALILLDSALARDSANVSLNVLKGQALKMAGDTVGAIQVLSRVLVTNPNHLGVRSDVMRMQLSRGNSADAIALLRQTGPRNRLRSPDGLLLYGDVYRSAGIYDTAIVLYRQAYDQLMRHTLPLPVVPPGFVLSRLRFSNGRSDTVTWRPGAATVFLFWARWSESSQAALRDVSAQVGKAAMTWRLIPVNVDSRDIEDAEAIRQVAVSLGCRDSVVFDADWEVVRRLGLDHVPCVVLVDYGGRIEDIVYGWGPAAQERILRGALGSLDTTAVPTEAASPDTVRGRARSLRASARQAWDRGQRQQALALIGRSIAADSSYHAARVDLVIYRWMRRDTLGARLQADKLVQLAPDMTWTRILDAHIAVARGDGAASLVALSGIDPDPDAVGAYEASSAVLAARQKAWDVATVARVRCDTLNRFHPLLQETDALLAEREDRLEAAAALWRQAVVDRLNLENR
ncbi:MAG: hypothetical protein Kow0074_12630 [Candidatus Zixiibacteriota bacterium]